MNVSEAFANWLESQSVATLGQNLFISRARSGKSTENAIYWLVAAGGSQPSKNVNGGVQETHEIGVYYRDSDPETVYNRMQTLRDLVSCAGCVSLDGYEVIEVETTGPFADNDLDVEGRTVGFLQVTITIYKEC